MATGMARVRRRLSERGLIAGAEGHVSIRLGPDVIRATPAGRCEGDLEADDLVELLTGPVPLGPYVQPGTDALADQLDQFLDEYDAFLFANDGAATVGATSRGLT